MSSVVYYLLEGLFDGKWLPLSISENSTDLDQSLFFFGQSLGDMTYRITACDENDATLNVEIIERKGGIQ